MSQLETPVNPMYSTSWVDGVPYDVFSELRREERPSRMLDPDGKPYWALVRHADVVAASRSPELFSNEPDPFTIPGGDPDAPHIPLLISLDPPAHTQRRQLINKGFTPRRVTRLTDRIREIVDVHLTKVRGQQSFDFVTDLAVELPLQVIAELLGIPPQDRKQVFGWTEQMMSGDDAEFDNSRQEVMAALGAMYGYSENLCQARRDAPGDDLMSALLAAELDGSKLDQMDLNLFFMLLHNAGSETTRNAISQGLVALLDHPDQLEQLRRDPGLMPAAVEEILRWSSPVLYFGRTAMVDALVGGARIKAGDRVSLWYPAGNRDSRAFADPDRFDITRSPNPHVTFGGGGAHYCLGANLAKREVHVMVEALVRRFDIEQVGPAGWGGGGPGVNVGISLNELPVRVHER